MYCVFHQRMHFFPVLLPMTLSARRSPCIIMHHIAHTWYTIHIRLWKAILTSISLIQKRPQLKREYNINPTIFNDKKSKLSPTTLKRRNKNNYSQIILTSPTAFIGKDISTVGHPLYHKQQMLILVLLFSHRSTQLSSGTFPYVADQYSPLSHKFCNKVRLQQSNVQNCIKYVIHIELPQSQVDINTTKQKHRAIKCVKARRNI